MKKGNCFWQFPLCSVGFLLLLGNGTGRAGSSTGAATKASISIDLILVFTLGDCSYGALACASTALHTTVIDNKCHCQILLSGTHGATTAPLHTVYFIPKRNASDFLQAAAARQDCP